MALLCGWECVQQGTVQVEERKGDGCKFANELKDAIASSTKLLITHLFGSPAVGTSEYHACVCCCIGGPVFSRIPHLAMLPLNYTSALLSAPAPQTHSSMLQSMNTWMICIDKYVIREPPQARSLGIMY